MASRTQTTSKPVVSAYIESLQAKLTGNRAVDDSSRAEKQRQADARQAEIRNGELALQLKRNNIQANGLDEQPDTSTPSTPGRRMKDVAEIDGKAVPSSPGHHSDDDLYSDNDTSRNPVQSNTMSLPANSILRIQSLESQLATHDTRIQKLEVERDQLTREVADLQKARKEAENALERAIVEGTETVRKHEETVAALRGQLEAVKEERNKAERDIEELNDTVKELRRQLNNERKEMSTLLEERLAVERSNGAVVAPAVAASTVGASSRRGSTGESERRRHGHRRSHSNGSSINIGFKIKWGDDKEKKVKKGSHK